MKKIILSALLAVVLLNSCKDKEDNTENTPAAPAIPAPAAIGYNIIKVYPHDTSSYTQGLIWNDGKMYEGTGMRGVSKLRVVDLNTGKATKDLALGNTYFGEGVTILNNKIYQLTWEEHKVFVYDMSFKKIQEFEWPYEGWGLTNDGKSLIVSTGGSNLYFVDPASFKIEKTVGVTDNNGYVDSLNELEYVNGSVYANRYGYDYILKINPTSGLVEGKIDLSDLLRKSGAAYDPRSVDEGYVLNGIAYDSTKQSFYITGKRWPVLCEVKFN